MTIHARHANTSYYHNLTYNKSDPTKICSLNQSSLFEKAQDEEDTSKETLSCNERNNDANAMSSTNHYSRKQQTSHNTITDKSHYVSFLFLLGLCCASCFSFLMSMSMDNLRDGKKTIRIKSINHTNNKHYLKHGQNIKTSKHSNKANKHRYKKMIYYMDLSSSLIRKSNPKLRNIHHDYDGIDYKSLKRFRKGRIIKDTKFMNVQALVVHNEDDDEYSVDQIEKFTKEKIDERSNKDDKVNCKSISWYHSKYPNCNSIHELSFINNTQVLSYGYYRDVLRYHDRISTKYGSSIKTLRYEHSYNEESYEMIRIDALVMEKLTFSKYIADIYGFCGTSILQELFMDDVEDVFVPREPSIDINGNEITKYTTNKFTPLQKLHIALDLAYPINDLHNYNSTAIIVHDDIQMGQYLFSFENELKLNDFNRAEIMFFNKEKQKYCAFSNGKVYGKFRSPEEVRDKPLNEKIDVYSYGNILYNLLTGLSIYYDMNDDEDAQDKIVNGETPYIDSIHKNSTNVDVQAFVHLMERCWSLKPDDRPTMKQVIGYLQNAIENSKDKLNGKIDWKSFTDDDADDDW